MVLLRGQDVRHVKLERGILQMRPFLLVVAALVFSACRDNTGPTPRGAVGLGFQVARSSNASVMAASVANADGTPTSGEAPVVTPSANGLLITRGTDEILITRAQVVVKDVKLETAAASCVDDDDDEFDDVALFDRRDRDSDDDDEDCPSIHTGPFLVNVPVNGSDGARVVVPVGEGTYSAVRLTLHKVTSNDSADRAFRQANPDFRDISVRLEGTYNGTPFIFVSDINRKIDVPLPEPLDVSEVGGDVTVTLDFGNWFVRPSGGLYSPALANTPGSVRNVVQSNIAGTFRAFCDRNRDGREDR